MTYIVYIPDVARGEAAYTQRSFISLKDLARWAIDAALETPAETIKHAMATPSIETETSTTLSATSIASDIKTLLSNLTSDLREPTETEVAASVEPSKEEDEDAFTADISEWFIEGTEFSKALEARNWSRCAHIVWNGIRSTAFAPVDGHSRDAIPFTDVNLFLNTVTPHLTTFAEDLVPELASVNWSALPSKFHKALEKKILLEPNGFSGKKAAHPVAKNFFQIINFFREGRRHKSWNTETVVFREIELYKAPTYQIALTLINDWWTGSKTTDEIREFMVKLTVLRFFVSANKSATVGSSEFLDQFFKYVMKLGLPAEFVAWATKGTTHRHCRKALNELNTVQARRAEGQRYIGLEEYKEKPITEEHPWCYDFAYNPLTSQTALQESDLILGEGGILSAWNSDEIQLMAPYGLAPV